MPLRAGPAESVSGVRRWLLVSSETAAGARQGAAEALRHRAAALVVVGGDEMAHLGANVVLRSGGRGPPLGIVPTGTGNDIATALGVPAHIPAATDALSHALATGCIRATTPLLSPLPARADD